MSMNGNVEKYCEYLINKLVIQTSVNELIGRDMLLESIGRNVPLSSKVTDLYLLEVTRHILREYFCYKVAYFTDMQQVTVDSADELFMLYKEYKQCDSKPQKHIKLSRDDDLVTLHTKYVCSLDTVCTKNLRELFGKVCQNDECGTRFEYKISMQDNKKTYMFSIYDYYDDNDEWYAEEDIYWHVATLPSTPKAVVRTFVQALDTLTLTLIQ